MPEPWQAQPAAAPRRAEAAAHGAGRPPRTDVRTPLPLGPHRPDSPAGTHRRDADNSLRKIQPVPVGLRRGRSGDEGRNGRRRPGRMARAVQHLEQNGARTQRTAVAGTAEPALSGPVPRPRQICREHI